MNVSVTKAHFIRCPETVTPSRFCPIDRDVYNSRQTELTSDGGLDSFLRTFNVEKGVFSAEISASALGVYDLFVNGIRVGHDELKPGWTDYNKRVFVNTYDISTYIKYGPNTVYARVSRGWYGGRVSFGYHGFAAPEFICGIDLTYDDGEREYISTDGEWKCAVLGPVMTGDLWDGEYYDARITPSDVISSDKWVDAVTVTRECELDNPVGPQVRARKALSLHPVTGTVYRGAFDNGSDYGEIRSVAKKRGEGCESAVIREGLTFLLDFAQNMVGRPVLTVRAASGTKITVSFGEMLNDSGSASRGNDGPQGSIYRKNYRSAISNAVYICNGSGKEVYFPTHAFYGFRYMEIEADGEAEIISVAGEVLGSDTREVSSFECSDPEINKLYSNIIWGQRSNYLSVPTDCPQRDERVGWTGDTQIFCGAAAYNADVSGFFKKWLGDCRDAQGEDGTVADVIPLLCPPSRAHNNNAAWADAVITVPYKMYRFYGDPSFISDNFAMMEKYMEVISSNETPGPNTAYGDWLCYDKTDKRYIADCYYAYDALLMALMCGEMKYIQKSVHYTKMYSSIKSAFLAKYTDENGLTIRTQTACLLALRSELLDGELREKTVKLLAELIKSNGYTLSTGFVGTGIINMTLSDVGLDDLCYSLLLQTRDPSWLYSVRQGATTIWERWNSYTLDKGFGDVVMNSFNHYAYGAVSEWLFSYCAGIGLGEYQNSFAYFTYRPRPDMRAGATLPRDQKPITYAAASYDTGTGVIKTRWERKDDCFLYELTVPDACKARTEIPVTGKISLNGAPFDCKAENGFYKTELSAGTYAFKVTIE